MIFTVNYICFMNSCNISFPLKQDEGNHATLSHPVREIQIEINSGKHAFFLHHIVPLRFWPNIEHTSAPLHHLCVSTYFPFDYQKGDSYQKNNDKITTQLQRSEEKRRGESRAEWGKEAAKTAWTKLATGNCTPEPLLHDTLLNLGKINISNKISCK